VKERRLTCAKAGALIGVSERQVQRLCAAYEALGPTGLVSKKRGGPGNRRMPDELRARTIALFRERYADFGPKLAHEKLLELHGIRIGRETLRKWLVAAGLWTTRRERIRKAHQPRHRRDCLGELVQIDGCEHAWFEDRGPACSLLVYVDDATGRAQELRFVHSESAFDYFAATASYLRRHGKPVAFYSDKHSIFRVYREGTTGPSKGVTQFGRALGELNIDIICANTPQAKGRVERMHQTLQDRLVKELRLRGISTMPEGNAFLPEFMADYNRRFGRPPRNPHDAHRPLRPDEDLDRIFTWQVERTLSRNLVVHHDRVTYLVQPGPDTLPLGGQKVRVFQWEDGRVELRHGDHNLPYSVFDEAAAVAQGAIVDNKRLGTAIYAIRVLQAERDEARLASKKLTVRQKERIRAAAATRTPPPATPGTSSDRLAGVLSYLRDFEAEQKARTHRQNRRAAFRREAAALGLGSLLRAAKRPRVASAASQGAFADTPADCDAPSPLNQ
jgi:hypothetical protein